MAAHASHPSGGTGAGWRSPAVQAVVVAAIITTIGVVVAALIQADDGDTAPPATTAPQSTPAATGATIAIEPESGPVATSVLVSGAGFAPGEVVELRISVDDILVGDPRSDTQGLFDGYPIVISDHYDSLAPTDLEIVAVGQDSGREARTVFHLS